MQQMVLASGKNLSILWGRFIVICMTAIYTVLYTYILYKIVAIWMPYVNTKSVGKYICNLPKYIIILLPISRLYLRNSYQWSLSATCDHAILHVTAYHSLISYHMRPPCGMPHAIQPYHIQSLHVIILHKILLLVCSNWYWWSSGKTSVMRMQIHVQTGVFHPLHTCIILLFNTPHPL